jgi:putative peptidoglycan lipid II flippase
VLIPSVLLNATSENLIIWAGWGVIAGGFLQTLVNLPYLKKIGYTFKIIIEFSGEAIHSLWKRFIPAMIGIGIREINLVADALMASFLPVGSITSLGVGSRLMQMPLGIFGISTGTAVLPLYSNHVTNRNWSGLSESIRFATISLSAVMIPITFIICGLGDDFVRILFVRGVFGARAALMTSQAFFYYSLGLVFFGLNQTITPLFYANKDTKTPVKIAAYMVALNIVLNFILMQFIQHRGLALSTSITAMVNYIILLKLIKAYMPEVSFTGIFFQIAKIIIINCFLFTTLYFINKLMFGLSLLQLIIKDIAMVFVYFLLFYLLAALFRTTYIDSIRKTLWSKLAKK